MTQVDDPVIVGAGPVGLAAALFLARQGITATTIDAAAHPAPHSKALAVNPRTLEILEPTGVTAKMLAIGKRIVGARISLGKQVVGEIQLNILHHRYPFMLALSQAVTVRLLEAALNEAGGHVEWNARLIHCQTALQGVEADVKFSLNGPTQTYHCPWLLAADGAVSTARRALEIEFEGDSFEKPWYLADVPLTTSLAQDWAHAYLLPEGGFLFLVRVVDEPEKESGVDRLWRVISDSPDPLEKLENAKPTGPAVWTSSFRISHRINARMQEGAICFAGDAAHVHSPLGARGMNLGIEDAWVFSQLLMNGQLADYGACRYSVDRRVVRQIKLFSRIARGESAAARTVRSMLFPALSHIGVARNHFVHTLTGLDHPLPTFAAAQAAI